MKIIHLLALSALFASCGTAPFAPDSPNPLDLPGGGPTAAEIRAWHLDQITGKPFHR